MAKFAFALYLQFFLFTSWYECKKHLWYNSENLGLRFFLHFHRDEQSKGNEEEEKEKKEEEETSAGVDATAAEGEGSSRRGRSEVDGEEERRSLAPDHLAAGTEAETDENNCETVWFPRTKEPQMTLSFHFHSVTANIKPTLEESKS